MEGYISTIEAARLLQINRQSVVRLIHRGTLPASRVGKSYAVRRSAVQQLADDPVRLLRTRRELQPDDIKKLGELVIEELVERGDVTRARNLLQGEEDAA